MSITSIDESFIHGAYSCERGDGWIRPWRLDCSQLPLYGHEAPVNASRAASGVRLVFRTAATSVRLHLAPDTNERPLDVALANTIVQRLTVPAEADSLTITDLPGNDDLVTIWLPHAASVQLVALEADGDIQPHADTRLRWLHYGSSISHGAGASRPACTWPVRVALAMDWNLTSVGLSGNCHMETPVARTLRDRPADLISLKCGINVCGKKSLNERTFLPQTIGMIQLIREKQPDVPIALIGPIFCPHREGEDFGEWLNLQQMRESHQEAVARLQAHGDDKITYIDGLSLFGAEQAHLLPDDLHPNDDGYAHLAERFVALVTPQLLAMR